MSDLVAIADVQEFLGTGAYLTDHLTWYLKGLSAFIRRYIDQPIETTEYTEALDGNGETVIRLTYRPVLSVESLSIDDVAVDVDDVKVYPDGDLYYANGFASGRQNISVTYDAGRGEAVPDDLQFAVMLICEQAEQTSSIKRAMRGEYEYVFAPDKWPQNAREIIESYRRKL